MIDKKSDTQNKGDPFSSHVTLTGLSSLAKDLKAKPETATSQRQSFDKFSKPIEANTNQFNKFRVQMNNCYDSVLERNLNTGVPKSVSYLTHDLLSEQVKSTKN